MCDTKASDFGFEIDEASPNDKAKPDRKSKGSRVGKLTNQLIGWLERPIKISDTFEPLSSSLAIELSLYT